MGRLGFSTAVLAALELPELIARPMMWMLALEKLTVVGLRGIFLLCL